MLPAAEMTRPKGQSHDRSGRAAVNAVVLKADRNDARAPGEEGALDLRDFCGQKLVVIFCPAAEAAADAELAAYAARAEAFQRAGSWLVAVTQGQCGAPQADFDAHLKLAVDPDGLAFQSLAAGFPFETWNPAGGIVFLVDRDGVARHAWSGLGRADDVLAGVRERP